MKHPEHALQRACVAYLRSLPPPPYGPWWTAVAPLPGTSAKQGALAKGLGLQAGTPDLVLLWNGIFIGIELKAPKGALSDSQRAAAHQIEDSRGHIYVCRTFEDFEAAIERAGDYAKQRAA